MIHILFGVNIFWAPYPLSHKPVKDLRQIDSLNPPHYLFKKKIPPGVLGVQLGAGDEDPH